MPSAGGMSLWQVPKFPNASGHLEKGLFTGKPFVIIYICNACILCSCIPWEANL